MIFYENSKGERIKLDEWPIMIQNEESLREYQWETTTKAGKRTYSIESMYKKVEDKNIELSIFANSELEFKNMLNHIFEVTEYDVTQKSPGKLYIGEQYLKCYVVSSKLDEYEADLMATDITLKILTDYPFWIREVEYYFRKQDQSSLESTDLDYPYDYEHDFKMLKGTEYFSNDHYTASDFIMRIFGPCTNPSITIADHVYNVNVNISDEEYLEIDSREPNRNASIFLHGKYGEIENCFGKRRKDSSPFEKIPPGECTLTWPANYDIALTLLQERSEPKWT